MSFDSHYWRKYKISDHRLEQMRGRLASGTGGVREFLELLRSDSQVAVGVALDHYRQAESLTRFGGENPYEEVEPTVLEVARRVLAQPSYPAPGEGDGEVALNHASALRVLGDLGDSDDSRTIATTLRANESPDVTSAALWAAGAALQDTDEIDDDLINAVADVVFDESAGMKDRVDAVLAFSHIQNDAVGHILEETAKLPHEELQIEALSLLLAYYSDSHYEAIAEIVQSWDRPEASRTKLQILRSFDAVRSKHRG